MYVCSYVLVVYQQPTKPTKDDDLPLVLEISLGIGILLIISIFVLFFCCCCPCCPLYRKRGKTGDDLLIYVSIMIVFNVRLRAKHITSCCPNKDSETVTVIKHDTNVICECYNTSL